MLIQRRASARPSWSELRSDIFSELDFLPGTVLMMEIGARYRNEQPESLARARHLMSLRADAAIAAE